MGGVVHMKYKDISHRLLHRSFLGKITRIHLIIAGVVAFILLTCVGIGQVIFSHQQGETGSDGNGASGGLWKEVNAPHPAGHIIHDDGEIDLNIPKMAGTKVLILAYHRGGSTIAGEVFNRNPDVFYWFEPLVAPLMNFIHHHPPEYRITPEDTYIKLKDGSFIEFPHHYMTKQISILANILNCHLDRLDHHILSHVFTTEWSKSESLTGYKACLRSYGHHSPNSTHFRMVLDKCLPLAIEKCKASSMRVVKTTRFGGYALRQLMEIDPSIKIIHVVRDPRGMLTSATTMWHMSFITAHLRELASRFCYRMGEDYRHLRMAEEIWPHSIYSLRYENLVTDYKKVIPLIYNFVGQELPDYIITWFDVNTHAERDDGLMGTLRQNGSYTAYKWKHVMPVFTQRLVNDICSEVMHEYGYTFNKFN